MDNKERMLASFVLAVGFWLINISHTTAGTTWGMVTALVSAIGSIALLVYSMTEVSNKNNKNKTLGWAYLIFVLAGIISWLANVYLV